MGFAQIVELLDQVEPPLRKIFVELFKLIEEQVVTKAEFNELRKVVGELAEAQKRTEERLNTLVQRIDELAEAQRRTEERLNTLAQRVDELAEAQRKTEERLNTLAQRVDELAEAQRKTEERLNELAEAQRKTEEEVARLTAEVRKIKEQVGGLSHTVGYVLEDRAYKGLPQLLKRDFGLDVRELKRDYVETAPGRYEEINIIGYGYKNGERVWILGDCKSQLKKRDVDSFEKRLRKMESYFPGEKLIVFVTYHTSPLVRDYLKGKGYTLYFSYELAL